MGSLGISEKEAVVLQLLLAGGELYGLQMIDQSDGALKRGTVYVTLRRMEDKGYLTSRQESRPQGEVGIPRRLYKITAAGERALRALEVFKLVLDGGLA